MCSENSYITRGMHLNTNITYVYLNCLHLHISVLIMRQLWISKKKCTVLLSPNLITGN